MNKEMNQESTSSHDKKQSSFIGESEDIEEIIEEDDALTAKHIYKKIEQLDRYIKKVDSRLHVLNNKLETTLSLDRGEEDKLKKGLTMYELDDKGFKA